MNAPPRILRFRIDGMSCGGCAGRVRSALLETAGVLEADVNLATASARVVVGSGVASAEVVGALKRAGYDAAEVRATDAVTAVDEEERALRERVRRARQGVVQAVVMWGAPIMALEFAGPVLASTAAGSDVWWRALQGVLCALALYSPAGAPILYGGLRAALFRTPNMDLLLTVGLLAAFGASAAAIVVHSIGHFHFHAVAMILAFVNVGRYLEALAQGGVVDATRALVQRLPRRALRITPDGPIEVDLGEVEIGTRLLVLSGAPVPVDGTITEGAGTVDESALTGESLPVNRAVGDRVLGGTVLTGGRLVINAERLGAESAIGQIAAAVQHAQAGRSGWQRLADRVAAWFVPVVCALALSTWLILGIGSGRWAVGFSRALAILVIACPCALGLATPAAIYVASTRAALQGILVRDAAALERLGAVDTVVFDKTGTLTHGALSISEIIDEPLGDTTRTPDEVLQMAASVSQFTLHPVSAALVSAARHRDLRLATPHHHESVPGRGVVADLDGHVVVVGSDALLEERGIDPRQMAPRAHQLALSGCNVVWVARDGVVAGLIAMRDRLRQGTAEAVGALHAQGINTLMLTGDRQETALQIAGALGIREVTAGIRPLEKATAVERLRSRGHRVAFVGDGINDAPALASADVGLAMATGTAIAQQAAGICILGHDLGTVPRAVAIGREAARIIRQNLAWAFGYNAVALPLACMGTVPAWLAPAAMMGSSLAVVLNALRLKRLC